MESAHGAWAPEGEEDEDPQHAAHSPQQRQAPTALNNTLSQLIFVCVCVCVRVCVCVCVRDSCKRILKPDEDWVFVGSCE